MSVLGFPRDRGKADCGSNPAGIEQIQDPKKRSKEVGSSFEKGTPQEEAAIRNIVGRINLDQGDQSSGSRDNMDATPLHDSGGADDELDDIMSDNADDEIDSELNKIATGQNKLLLLCFCFPCSRNLPGASQGVLPPPMVWSGLPGFPLMVWSGLSGSPSMV